MGKHPAVLIQSAYFVLCRVRTIGKVIKIQKVTIWNDSKSASQELLLLIYMFLFFCNWARFVQTNSRLIFPVDWLHLLQHFPLFVISPFLQYLDHNHPTSPLLAKPPELSEEAKLPASMKFVAANTVGE